MTELLIYRKYLYRNSNIGDLISVSWSFMEFHRACILKSTRNSGLHLYLSSDPDLYLKTLINFISLLLCFRYMGLFFLLSQRQLYLIMSYTQSHTYTRICVCVSVCKPYLYKQSFGTKSVMCCL